MFRACDGESRLIPARAGKTALSTLTFARGRAHPRACGENTTHRRFPAQRGGSSPRVRGKHTLAAERDVTLRLIPARAGKTLCAGEAVRGNAAHPRACGENGLNLIHCCMSLGSSPRVRGKRRKGVYVQTCNGLIPARAGKTPNQYRYDKVQPGSSPRVRGKHREWNANSNGLGLIPARAGKTNGGTT